MSYVLPQVQVFQEFNVTPAGSAAPQSAHITGGHAQLFRYAQANEKAVIGIGEYNPADDTPYAWPQRPAGAQVDFSYVKLWCDGALLQYYADFVGSGGTIAPVAGYKNRVRSSVTTFATNGSFVKSDTMLDRGAVVGDIVYVRGTGTDSQTYELWSKIIGFQGDVVPSSIASATAATSNKAAQSYATSVDDVGGKKNTITLTADGTGYDGRIDGAIDETYLIEVTQSSVGGDLTTAKLRVTSASGNDNVASVSPTSIGGFTAIGANGLLVEFDRNETPSASSAAGEDNIAPDDLVVGQKWKVRVIQAFTPAVATSGGSYTGGDTTTLIVQVVSGGSWADGPTVKVTTTTGVDKSGPTTISSASTAYGVGSFGATISFSGTGLVTGDKYYIGLTPQSQGYLKTIILQDDLPVLIQTASDLDLKLFITSNIQISINQDPNPPLQNYSTSDTQIVVAGSIVLFNSAWTDNGVQVALPLEGGDLFVEYRCWLDTFVGQVASASDPSALTTLLGQADPDNPLYWGVYMALLNSNGQDVMFSAVTDPSSTDDWLSALSLLVGRQDVYNLVPLTTDRTVTSAWQAHVDSQSSSINNRWRGAVFGISIDHTKPIVTAATTSDLTVALATLTDDPQALGTQYTILSVPTGNSKFLTNGVLAGDVVRYLFDTDGFGNDVWTEFTVDAVLSENTLRLTSGNSIAINVAQKVEVWRNLKASDLTQAVQDAVGVYADRRVVAIANETVGNAGLTFAGYFAAAAVAGLRSGVNPHQGLTNVTLTGIDDVGVLVKGLNGDQLNLIAGSGGWIIIKTPGGSVINRHAVTTDTTELNFREEMVRVNLDSISFGLYDVFVPYIGQSNVTPDVLNQLNSVLTSKLNSYTVDVTPRIGAQLTSYSGVNIRQDAVLLDHVIITVSLVLPYPLNNIILQLEV